MSTSSVVGLEPSGSIREEPARVLKNESDPTPPPHLEPPEGNHASADGGLKRDFQSLGPGSANLFDASIQILDL